MVRRTGRLDEARALLAEVVIHANLLAGDLVARGGIHGSSGFVQDLACVLGVLRADHDVVRSNGAQSVSTPAPLFVDRALVVVAQTV